MMYFFTSVLIVVTGGIIIAAASKVRLTGDFCPTGARVSFSAWWIAIEMDFLQRIITFRLLGIRIIKRALAPHEDKEKKPEIDRERRERKKEKLKKRRDKKSDRKGVKKDVFFSIWQERDLIIRAVYFVVNIVKRMIKATRCEQLTAHLVVATPDPMMTGVVFGALAPLSALSRLPQRKLTFQIDFQSDYPRGDLLFVFSLRPIVPMYIMLSEMIRLPWVRIVRIAWKYWRSRRN